MNPGTADLQLRIKHYDSRHYSELLFSNPKVIIDHYLDRVDRDLPEHDTLIGTGLSGSIAAGLFAAASDKMFAVIRKRGVIAHSDNKLEGRVGSRWLFVDDFVSSGYTYRTVCDTVRELVPDAVYVGGYLYTKDEIRPA